MRLHSINVLTPRRHGGLETSVVHAPHMVNAGGGIIIGPDVSVPVDEIWFSDGQKIVAIRVHPISGQMQRAEGRFKGKGSMFG